MRLSPPDLNSEYTPAIAADSDGGHVAVWTVVTADGLEVYGQLFNSAGEKVGEPFHANTFVEHSQGQPAVTMEPDGGFVVVWTSDGQDEAFVFGDYLTGGVFGRLFDDAGQPRGPEFQVNTTTAGSQMTPDVASDGAGNIVVTWAGPEGVFLQRYDPAGAKLGGEMRLNATPDASQAPGVASTAGGSFVVTWSKPEPDAKASLWAQRFDPQGERVGDPISVNPASPSINKAADVGIDAAGNFVVTWDEGSFAASPTRVRARRYSAAGEPAGDTIDVATNADFLFGNVSRPRVAVSPTGAFFVAYTHDNSGREASVFGRAFDAAGVAESPRGLFVSRWISDERWPAAAAISGGEILVAWQGPREGSDSAEIHAQRFAPLADPATVRGVAWADTNRNGLREAGEAPLESVRVGAYTWAGVQVSDTVTAADGSYVLGNIRGDMLHFLWWAGPPAAAYTTPNAGNDDTVDSDVLNDPLNAGRTALFTAPAGGEAPAQDAGILLPVALEGIVWNDVDADGVREPGETGRDGVAVILFDASGRLGSVITSNGGRYRFGPLAPHTYWLRIQNLPGLSVTAGNQGSDDTIDNDFTNLSGQTDPVTPVPGQTAVLDAGVGPPTAINGAVFRDADDDGQRSFGENGLGGWTVFSDYNGNGRPDAGEAVTTSLDLPGATWGSFTLRVPPGTHTVIALPPGDVEPGVLRPHSNVEVALGALVPLNLPFLPWVTGVFVSGSTWSEPFRQTLAAGPGIRIAWSAHVEGTLLHFGGIDRISVSFAEPQTLGATDLEVRGRNGRTYAPVDYAYDRATRTATWTLESAITYDAVSLRLRRAATGTVEALGNPVRVLVGELTSDSRVDRRDLWQVRIRLGASLENGGNGTLGYELGYDLNGDGRINALDLALQLRNYGRREPVPDSAGGAANGAASMPALAFVALPAPGCRRRSVWDEFAA